METEDPKAHPEADVPQVKRQIGVDVVTRIYEDVDQAVNERNAWVTKNKLYYEKRYGVRAKKNFPWPGCSNLHLPLIDKVIRRVKPMYAGLVLNRTPIASFEPEVPQSFADIEHGRTAEQFFHWMIRNRVPDFERNLVIGVDHMCSKGFAVFKIVYRHETRDVVETFRLSDLADDELQVLTMGEPGEPDPETGEPTFRPLTREEVEGFFAAKGNFMLDDPDDLRAVREIVAAFHNGQKNVKVKRREVVHSAPMMVAVDPLDVIVPGDTTDVESARFIAHRMYLTPNDLRQRERDGLYSNVEEVMHAERSQDSNIESGYIRLVKEAREGVSEEPEPKSIEIHEIFTYQDLNGDGVDERVVVTMQPDTKVVLRAVPLPYDHGMWPFVKVDFELTDGRWYSPRGLAEMLMDLQTEITAQHNAKLDRMTIQNSPTFQFRQGAIRNMSTFRWIPGQHLSVVNPGADVVVNQIPVLDSSFQTEENVLRQWAEEYVGISDFGLTNPLSTGGSEKRTATEVSSINSIITQTFSLDAKLFQHGMRRVYEQLWSLWNQYGPDEVYIRVMGQEQPKLIARADIQGRWSITPTGEFENSNRQIEWQKAQMRLQTYANHPMIRQDALLRDALDKDDPRLTQLLMKTKEEMEQEQQMEAQGGAPVRLESLAKGLTMAAKSQPKRRVAV